MATLVAKSATATVHVEAGRDSEGNMKYVNVSMGKLDKDYVTNSSTQGTAMTKILAVKDALAPCLDNSIGDVGVTMSYTVTAA